jgi:hypothetical protein
MRWFNSWFSLRSRVLVSRRPTFASRAIFSRAWRDASFGEWSTRRCGRYEQWSHVDRYQRTFNPRVVGSSPTGPTSTSVPVTHVRPAVPPARTHRSHRQGGRPRGRSARNGLWRRARMGISIPLFKVTFLDGVAFRWVTEVAGASGEGGVRDLRVLGAQRPAGSPLLRQDAGEDHDQRQGEQPCPPMPCRAREATSHQPSGAAPTRNDAVANTVRPTMNRRRRPTRSLLGPSAAADRRTPTCRRPAPTTARSPAGPGPARCWAAR